MNYIYAPKGKRRIAYQTTITPATLPASILAKRFKVTLTVSTTPPPNYEVRSINDLGVIKDQRLDQPPTQPRPSLITRADPETLAENLRQNGIFLFTPKP